VTVKQLIQHLHDIVESKSGINEDSQVFININGFTQEPSLIITKNVEKSRNIVVIEGT